VLDGIEATQAIRAIEASIGGHIPIIAVTAAAMKEDAEACRAAGMDAYLAKPIHSRMLQTLLAEFAPLESLLTFETTQRETMTSFVEPGSRSSADSQDSGSSSGSSGQRRMAEKLQAADPDADDKSIDLRAAASRVPGGLPGVRRLAEVFIPECESLLQAMHKELPGGDPIQVQRAAHTLKGSCNLFYAKRVSEVAASIEELSQAKDLEAASDRLPLLDKEAEAMLRALRNFLEITKD
jgi:two-component system, sensor histidine kinase and response regulator